MGLSLVGLILEEKNKNAVFYCNEQLNLSSRTVCFWSQLGSFPIWEFFIGFRSKCIMYNALYRNL